MKNRRENPAGKAVAKYLQRYAEPEIELASRLPENYREVLVIPALREDLQLFEGVRRAARASERTLVILVVNASVDASMDARRQNSTLLLDARERFEIVAEPRENVFLGRDPDFDVLAIDRSRERFALPRKQGVGLARKIGADVALALAVEGRLDSPWIHTSDADASQFAERFASASAITAARPNAVGITFPFRHTNGGSPGEPTLLYEVSLHYYVLGLRWAGSPYAFHSVGSTLAVRADAYAHVRGFPKRLAGEDFYLLEKLSKIGQIVQPECAPVLVRGRDSDRVPFGTGPALRRIREQRSEGREFHLDHPRCFGLLKGWMGALGRFAEGEPLREVVARWVESLPSADREAALGALDTLEALEALEQLRSRTPSGGLRRAAATWFDAIRTLRFLHEVRDRGFPDLPWEEALSSAPFVPTSSARPLAGVVASLAERSFRFHVAGVET